LNVAVVTDLVLFLSAILKGRKNGEERTSTGGGKPNREGFLLISGAF